MAQAILIQDVGTLGEKGDVVDVSPGYLRNFLVPRKLAQPATAGSIADAQRRKDAAEKAVRELAEKAQENAALLSKTVLTITHPAGDDGRLFGSVTAQEIVEAIRQARGLRLDRRKVQLAEPIRHTGSHMVTVEVHDGVTATVKTIVTAGYPQPLLTAPSGDSYAAPSGRSRPPAAAEPRGRGLGARRCPDLRQRSRPA